MTPDQIFSIVNLMALSGWILLAALPGRHVVKVVAGAIVPALLAIVYIGILAVQWNSSSGGFSTLREVAMLFSNPWLLLAGWTHYLAFDLLIGNWEVRDARERAVPHLLVLPCLVLTFLFGPAGWLSYVTLRSRFRPSVTHDRSLISET
jgi:Domain of unknown function (DUF4281)